LPLFSITKFGKFSSIWLISLLSILKLEYRKQAQIRVMTSIRKELERKLNNLSPEQLNSVRQFVNSLEDKQPAADLEYPLTNEDIDRVVESYRQQNKSLPIGLAKGEFTVPEDFNDPLPDEILDLFNNSQ
jgi:hypothetical protein